MSADLAGFLLQRIAEDEEMAKRAAFGWGAAWHDETDEEWSAVHADGQRDMVGCEDGDVTRHIARWDPARVLAECKHRRRIVAVDWRADDSGPADALRDDVLRLLALPFADHPDFDPSWRP